MSTDEIRTLDAAEKPGRGDRSTPDSPAELDKHSWAFVVRKTVREFSKDECTDLAAALTYYAVLAMFPAAIALLSLLGLVGQGPDSVRTILHIVSDVGASSIADTLHDPLLKLANAPSAGVTLVIGLVVALWSASGYVGAFGRALNRVYGVGEGRPIWKLRPLILLVTFVLVVLAAVMTAALVVTGPVANSIGDQLGLGSTTVLIWDIAKWPIMLIVVVFMVALLYYATPNVKQPKFRWLSPGATVAIVVWIVLTAAFGFYVANFSSYDATYGALAGAIVLLLWLWLTNVALLFGAELDAEVERGRELQSGVDASESIELPLRDRRNIDKARAKDANDVRRADELRSDARSE